MRICICASIFKRRNIYIYIYRVEHVWIFSDIEHILFACCCCCCFGWLLRCARMHVMSSVMEGTFLCLRFNPRVSLFYK